MAQAGTIKLDRVDRWRAWSAGGPSILGRPYLQSPARLVEEFATDADGRAWVALTYGDLGQGDLVWTVSITWRDGLLEVETPIASGESIADALKVAVADLFKLVDGPNRRRGDNLKLAAAG